MAGALAGAVDRPQPLQDDAFDVVGGAGGEQVCGVDAGEAGQHAAGPGQPQFLEPSAPFEVGPLEERFAVDPEQVEGPERHRGGRPGMAAADEVGEQPVEVAGRPGAGHELAVEHQAVAQVRQRSDAGNR